MILATISKVTKRYQAFRDSIPNVKREKHYKKGKRYVAKMVENHYCILIKNKKSNKKKHGPISDYLKAFINQYLN